jgi:choline dehydrogenase
MRAENYDYVIVGAGSAGCVMANRLSADPDVSVLLLEAGGRNRSIFIDMPAALSIPMNQKRFNWGYKAQPAPGLDDRALACPRGRGLGGSSAINGMVYVRGNAQDFDRWDALIDDPNADWSYAGVLPYFKKAERCLSQGFSSAYRGTTGHLVTQDGRMNNVLYERFLQAGVQAGYALSDDLNGYQQEGVGPFPMTVDTGRRCSAARAYLAPVMHRQNLKIVTNARVDRISFDQTRVDKLVWYKGRRRQTTYVGREIVVCAGAIDSPCVLQRSGIGPADLLTQMAIPVLCDLPVGENLMDHLEVYVQQACPPQMSLNRSLSLLNKALIGARWLTLKNGLGATNHFEAGGFVRSAAGVPWPDVQFHFLPAAMNYDGTQVSDVPGYQVHVGPMLPHSRGRVRITSASPDAAKEIQFNYMADQRDVEDFRACVELTRDLISQPALADLGGRELQPGADVSTVEQIDRWIRQNAQSAYHPCGTCAMGTGPDGVVDGQARVKNVSGLRVVDASVFPMITNGNLNAPTIMAAEKISAAMLGCELDAEQQPFYRHPRWQTEQR